MAQIIGANSLIYIEDGNFGAGWYIIPPGSLAEKDRIR